jgi:hypothetical protein
LAGFFQEEFYISWKTSVLGQYFMSFQPFGGELRVEDPRAGNMSLYPFVGEDTYGEILIELHNANPPNSLNTLITGV